MARYVVVMPLAPLERGDEFTVADWPLHVTVVEPFESAASPEQLVSALQPVAGRAHVVRTTAGENAMFGRRRDVPVSLIRDGGEIVALREAALAALAAAGLDLGRVRPDFRPHVTVKRHGRLYPGDHVAFDRLALIDMRPPAGSRHRAVVGVLSLDPEPSRHPDPP
ncbi:2'-5' RNA ligase family protein [Agromyces aerolatus]|uniref:2'-5' RNA ligase family protein n=1 Tax=Agromyces sp. LY-1074 TaxID=3074080 RepID=UPI00285F19AB|nr:MULTISPECIES: 2'-5' RNA ligase family protein [unclassified Agromyces]MDR5700298.1 2'-5' RNA ligase family protein [Agromyces sp. LY-1074]MDR5706724.1 2'-5' RNA ligase family protein [Agromyces sp. LY-1358]